MTRATLARLLRDQTGATAIEYGLLVALIAIAMIAALTTTGTSLSGVMNTVTTTMAAV